MARYLLLVLTLCAWPLAGCSLLFSGDDLQGGGDDDGAGDGDGDENLAGDGDEGGDGDETGDGDADLEAIEFCLDYEDVCTFDALLEGARYADAEDCELSYVDYSLTRQDCVQEHLLLAEGDPRIHCPHVTGLPPCGPD